MGEGTLFVYAYDLADGRERRRVDALLQGYGFRRQKSVFECRLSRHQAVQLKRQLRELDLATGFVVIYPVSGHARVDTVGTVPHFPDDDWTWIA